MSADTMQQPRVRRFTVAEYHRMGDAGILSEEDRVELIDGEIVEMTPIGSRHAACVDRLNRILSSRLSDRAQVRIQSPIFLNDISEPQPDAALLRLKAGDYADGHPGPGDVLLVVEVADTTLNYDRTVKAPRYAAAGIPELWVVDLQAACVEVYRHPRERGYRERVIYFRGEVWEPVDFPGVTVAVDDVLPPEG